MAQSAVPMSSPPVAPPEASSAPPPTPPVEAAPKPKVLVKLDRHYKPMAEKYPHEVVGHWTPKVEVKNAKTGKMEVLQEAAFHEGEPMPPPQAGVGSLTNPKLWAGTVVRFTADEARYVRQNGIGTVEIDDAA